MLFFNSTADARQRLEQFLTDSFRSGTALPFSFIYKGESSRNFLKDWQFETTEKGIAFRCPDGLLAEVEIRTFEDFPAVEWLLTFENTGETDSGLLEEVHAMDMYVEAAPFRTAGTQQYGALDNILYYNGGSDCKADDFIPCQEILHHISARKEMTFSCMGGRPTSGSHGSFPYFHMKTLDRGVFFAIGWSGQWQMQLHTRKQEYEGAPDSFQFTGGMPGIATVLYPGEKIRTARILFMTWDGDIDDAKNQSRRFLLKYHMPHVDGKPAVLPISLSSWGYNAKRNKEEIDAGVRSGLPFDTYWVDAGWYGPEGTHCDDPYQEDWSYYVGWYSHDPSRYPLGLGEVGDYAHANGLRFLLWNEPDRATVQSPSYQEHPEYYLSHPISRSRMLNLGCEEAYQWALEMLSDKIENYHLDVLRIDYNMGPLDSWRENDVEGRRGMTEIRAVENFYRLWIELRRRFPHLLIDNCASGGRRLDFEANTNSVALFRTDYLCYADCSPTGFQVQTAGLAPFVPLTGMSFCGEPTWYNLFSSLAAGFAVSATMVEPLFEDEEGMEQLRRKMEVFNRARPLFAGDFYLFTSVTLDEKDWFAYQLNDAASGTACVMSARRSECPMQEACYKLRGLEETAVYVLEDAETGTVIGKNTGAQLMTEGLRVSLSEPETASLIFITKGEGME